MQQKYWLADNGEVRCLDDRCPQECDLECPIYLQTIALPYVQNGHFDEAAKYLEKAVRIEPMFAEAWNNLAACYGQLGRHQEAYQAYLKSFDLLEKPKPLFGMAVAAKNMGKNALAMQYVAMYERRYGKDEMISSLSAEISERQLTSQINETSKKDSQPVVASASKKNVQADVDQGFESDMRAFGAVYLSLLDPSTRERGYKELEKMESRFPEAGIPLGQYYQGNDLEQARKHFKVAADAGIAEGQWGYAQSLPHSRVLELSNAKDQDYLKYCLAAAEGGCPDAANEMGNICHRLEFYEESTYWYGMAYSLEHPSGIASLRGITKEWAQKGVVKDFRPHLEGFTEDRHATALLIYKMFNQSLDTQDMDELMRLTLKGENLAGFIEAKLFEQGNHDDMAYKVYNALAFEDHPYALRCYADMILAGKGTARDVEKAFYMYNLSARKGNETAMFAMGQKAFKDGDMMMAAAWFGQAYSRGLEMAGDWLIRLSNKGN